jgi:hypothetical protein
MPRYKPQPTNYFASHFSMLKGIPLLGMNMLVAITLRLNCQHLISQSETRRLRIIKEHLARLQRELGQILS